jgi:hypothetical protein
MARESSRLSAPPALVGQWQGEDVALPARAAARKLRLVASQP